MDFGVFYVFFSLVTPWTSFFGTTLSLCLLMDCCLCWPSNRCHFPFSPPAPPVFIFFVACGFTISFPLPVLVAGNLFPAAAGFASGFCGEQQPIFQFFFPPPSFSKLVIFVPPGFFCFSGLSLLFTFFPSDFRSAFL